MAPPVRALAQSESKAKFMERLGLDDRNAEHKHIYQMMKQEANTGRHRMMAMPDLLRVDGEQSAQPPFSHAQINETVTHRQILNIYQHARPETKVYYDKGRDIDGIEEENWVIRWLLWHVFRYRDNRNNSRRQASPLQRSSSGSEHSNGENQSTNHELNNEGNSVSTASKNSFYDPVRDN